jgi:FAD/FMN-containing dehydrogenase
MRLVEAGEPGYEALRRPAIDAFADARPAAVACCAGAADVAEALALARARGLHAVPRSGGHCFAGRSTTDGLVIDLSPADAVTLDGDHARIGAGARLAGVYAALATAGRTLPAGCGPGVGIAGLTLGGGLGILGRRHGLLCDALVEAEVVLADGRVLTCDAGRDADLFWALRGAGGCSFGIVTTLTFATLPVPYMTAFRRSWPGRDAAAVLEAWQDWSPGAPPELAASLLIGAPPTPDDPVEVTVAGAMIGGDADAAGLLDALADRVGTAPSHDVRRSGTHGDAKRLLVEADEAAGGVTANRNEFFRRSLPRDAIDALVAHLRDDRVPGQARTLDLSPWGGAYNAVPESATAFAHRGERFLLKHSATVAPAAGPAERATAHRWATGAWRLTRPHGTGRAYPNFPDPDLPGWARAYHAGNLERLVAAKRRYDPADVLRFHQSVPLRVPAAG